MKKRLLVLLAFGVSFAPPVFAGVKIGQEKLSETSMAGVVCVSQEKHLPDEGKAAVIQQADAKIAEGASRAL